jgi:multiple sugar transport system permease protein
VEPRKPTWLFWIFALFLVLLWISPILATLLTSLKTLEELNQGLYWTIPKQWSLDNYLDAFLNGGFSKYFINSFIYTIPSVVGIILFSSLNGFVLSKLKFRGRENITLLFLAGMLLPFQILLIPVFYLSSNVLGTYDSYLGVILFHIAFQLGFSSFFMRNFMKSIPDSIIEAARMDGCGNLKIFVSVVLPLMKPAIAALSTLLFTWIWNDYLWALILIQSDELKPVTTALENLKGQWVSSYNLQSAGAIIAAIPPVLIFALLQRHFVKGLTMGSGK